MRLRYTDRASSDLYDAFDWYERQRLGLGLEFLDSVEIAIQFLITLPEACPIKYRVFRSCVVRRFPFSIYYTIEGNELIIHSVFHHRRDPETRP